MIYIYVYVYIYIVCPEKVHRRKLADRESGLECACADNDGSTVSGGRLY